MDDVVEALGKDAKVPNISESDGFGSIFLGWGMSIASKRAKERQNRSSDELVMDETKISRR